MSLWYVIKALILSALILSSCHDPSASRTQAELWQTDNQGQVLTISGMHCEACAQKIEKKLMEHDGVSMAKVDFDKGLLKVDFDESKVSLETIKDTIASMGFKVSE